MQELTWPALTDEQQSLLDKFFPLGERVIYRRHRPPEKTESGVLYLPDTSYERSIFAKIVVKGIGTLTRSGIRVESTSAKPGDVVVVRQFEDKGCIHPALKDFFLCRGRVVEALLKKGRWSFAPDVFEKVADRLDNANYHLQPLMDWVVILKDYEIEKTPGGILLPEVSRDLPVTGRLLAVGPGYQSTETGKFIANQVTAGEKVIFSPYAGYKVEIDGITYYLMQEKDLFATCDEATVIRTVDNLTGIPNLQISD